MQFRASKDSEPDFHSSGDFRSLTVGGFCINILDKLSVRISDLKGHGSMQQGEQSSVSACKLRTRLSIQFSERHLEV